MLLVDDAPGFDPAPVALLLGHGRIAIGAVEAPGRAQDADLVLRLIPLLGKVELAVAGLDRSLAVAAGGTYRSSNSAPRFTKSVRRVLPLPTTSFSCKAESWTPNLGSTTCAMSA